VIICRFATFLFDAGGAVTMSQESMQVLKMLADGRISVEQANQLLQALGEAPPARTDHPRANVTSMSMPMPQAGTSKLGSQLGPHEIASMSALGIDAAYVRELREAGLTDFQDELIALKGVGVDAAWVREMRQAGVNTHDAGDLVALRGVGVTAAYIEELRAAGLRDFEDELPGLCGVGVTADYIEELRAAGVRNIEENVVALKGVGVDGEWIRSLQAAGMTELDADELIGLKGSGVDADYLREVRELTAQF